jgi:hypothetical protein
MKLFYQSEGSGQWVELGSNRVVCVVDQNGNSLHLEEHESIKREEIQKNIMTIARKPQMNIPIKNSMPYKTMPSIAALFGFSTKEKGSTFTPGYKHAREFRKRRRQLQRAARKRNRPNNFISRSHVHRLRVCSERHLLSRKVTRDV